MTEEEKTALEFIRKGATLDCPTTGRVPARVVDAYLAATEAGAA